MSFTKHLTYGAAALAAGASMFLAMPAQAAALTSSQLQQVSTLLSSFGVGTSTIGVVNNILANSGGQGQGGQGTGSMGTSTPSHGSCPPILITLHRGDDDQDTGGDVSGLQQFLEQNGYLTASTTGTFGPMTQNALMHFQKDNGVQGNGSTFGPQSRGIFGKRCGQMGGPGMMGTSTLPWGNGSSTPPNWGNGSSTQGWMPPPVGGQH